MIVDTFLFDDELDMLECRLTELEDAVDRFVLVEAPETFRGERKPFVFTEHRARFGRWLDRITVIHADLAGVSPWERETSQREATALGLADVPADARVMHGDVDEIPDPALVSTPGTYVFAMRHAAFAVNWLDPRPWPGTVSVLRRDIGTFRGLRRSRAYFSQVAGGWHLSWLGTPEQRQRKQRGCLHDEVRDLDIESLIRQHTDGQELAAGKVDETWPRWIREGHAPASWFR